MVSAWRNFKNIFPRPLFIIIFRPEMLKFHPYSILTMDTRVEFVIYCVLSIEQFLFMAVDDQKLVFDPCQKIVVQSNTFSPNQNHFGIIEGQAISS